MANLLRLINNVCNNNNEIDKVFRGIDRKFPEYGLGSPTPIPNQVLPTDLNDENMPSIIYFSKSAYSKLQKIRDIDHKCSVVRSSKGIADKPLEFALMGYRDWDGNIFINNIEVPIFEQLASSRLSTQKGIEAIATDKNISYKDLHTETTSRVFDYLKNNKFAKSPIGSELVALLGTTKHANKSNPDASNCFTMSELAESVIPNVKVHENITSGILSITPKTLETNKRSLFSIGTPKTYLNDGSLECALVSYLRNEQSGYVKPIGLTNVTRAKGVNARDEHESIMISSSSQPIKGLYYGRAKTRSKILEEMER